MKNLLTKEAFAEWCEKQPADEEYKYWCNECAFGQYLSAHGIKFHCIGTATWSPYNEDEPRALPSGIDAAVREGPTTFGALAARLRESQP